MRGIGQRFRRPPAGHMGDRNGGLARLSPRRTLLAENLASGMILTLGAHV